MMCLLLSGKIW